MTGGMRQNAGPKRGPGMTFSWTDHLKENLGMARETAERPVWPFGDGYDRRYIETTDRTGERS